MTQTFYTKSRSKEQNNILGVYNYACHDVCVLVFFDLTVSRIMAESKRFVGRVTVVTGGSRGIGKACVKLFGER